MFIRNKDLKISLGETFNIDISIKQLDRMIKAYEKQSGLVINRIWNENVESRVNFVSFIKDNSINIALKIAPPLPKNYELCGNPYKYDSIGLVEDYIRSSGKEGFYKGVKCGKCKKYHMIKATKN